MCSRSKTYLASEDVFEHEYDEIGERMGHAERSKIFGFGSERERCDSENTIRGLEAGATHQSGGETRTRHCGQEQYGKVERDFQVLL